VAPTAWAVASALTNNGMTRNDYEYDRSVVPRGRRLLSPDSSSAVDQTYDTVSAARRAELPRDTRWPRLQVDSGYESAAAS